MRGITVLLALFLVPAAAQADDRLTLGRADVPGLHAAGTGGKAARAAFGRRVRRAQVQGAAFAGDGLRLRVGVATLRSRGAAKQALGRRRRVRRTRRTVDATVAFRVGRTLAAVRVTAPRARTRAGVRIAAGAYADALRGRLQHVLGLSAWDRTLEGIGADGDVSPRLALRAFDLAYGRGGGGRLSGTLATQFVARVWDQLTAAERARVEAALGAPYVAGVRRAAGRRAAAAGRHAAGRRPAAAGRHAAGRRAAAAGRHAAGRPVATAADVTLTPDATLQAIADQHAAYYAQHLGTPAPDIRVFRADQEITAGDGAPVGADALPLNSAGEWGQGTMVFCRIRVVPSTIANATAITLRYILAHEVFHCFQFQLMDAWRQRTAWIIEGTAVWAGLLAAQVPQTPGSGDYRTYLETANAPLFGRAYDAVGFWGRAEELGGIGSLWPKMPAILDAATDAESFAIAGGAAGPFVATWASSTFRFPSAGSAWNQTNPYPLPHTALAPPATVVASGTTLGTNPYQLHEYVVAKDPSAPLVNITKLSGTLRAGTSQKDFGTVGEDWFCFGSCACPAGTAGEVPTHHEVAGALLSLGLTGGAAQGGGRVTFHDLDEFCSEQPESGVTVSGATTVTVPVPGYCVRPAPDVFQVQLPLNQGGKKVAQVVLEVTGFHGAGTYPTGPSVATVYDFRPKPAHLWDTAVSGEITIADPGGAAGEGARGTVDSVTSGESPALGTTQVSVSGRWRCV